MRLSIAATKAFKFTRIDSDKHGALIVGLMIAANDIYLANWSAIPYQEENVEELPRMRRHLRIGALQYFVRLMLAHLHEALPLIRQFEKCPELKDALKRCSKDAQAGYAAMCECLPGGKDYAVFAMKAARLRNKLSFHYDSQHVKTAISRLANDRTQPPALITMGGDYFLSRFNLADRVADSILVHQVLQSMPGSTDREKLDNFMNFINQKCLAFLRFAKEFCGTYFSR
jgi:hypothetical protein